MRGGRLFSVGCVMHLCGVSRGVCEPLLAVIVSGLVGGTTILVPVSPLKSMDDVAARFPF